ncbi:unnamed protein product [Arabis nemorensis]|uniref:Zinc knuckle CX2CX4HX4C domain-containing protein n=1 Tax=Arabis nemorensis TaxID=586526 RepID=A0A565AUK5_9BRAS|nr:unnamed protein product [Arabis nemorensis]
MDAGPAEIGTITAVSFPSEIPFWIKINDLPTHFGTYNNLKAIGSSLGRYLDQDTKERRIQVGLQAYKPLVMKDYVHFKTGGEKAPVEFDYEHLEKHCFVCFALTYEEKDYPKVSKDKRSSLQAWR